MNKLLIVFLLVALNSRATAQTEHLDTLTKIFPGVLLNYPEIKKVSVDLVFTEKKRHVMWARPRIGSFFRKDMKYVVFVSTDTMYSGFLDTLSTDAILGWYAHELGHVVDYERRGRFRTFWIGIQYLFSPKGRTKLEYRADRIAIEHGYGCELLASVNISRKHLPAWKRKQVERFYLKRAQLEELIKICEQRKE
ncbi:MAG: hypothetical protein KBC12_01565 [Candidatus Pacebacteria bacterium]|nr:hypothetical protein [Candidatus Paceibacterota bacterium]